MKTITESALAASITWEASKQTYYTVRLLVDRDRVPDAYQAYAYFRWLDDRLDQEQSSREDRLRLVKRQQQLVNEGNRGVRPAHLCPQERMLFGLIREDQEKDSGLKTYIDQMMAVMAFDASRRGRLASQAELVQYTRSLAMAVTEALHYFVGHDCQTPHCKARYLAASGAHIAHMLRDTMEDNASGYYNVPREYLESHRISPEDVGSPAYRAWVAKRVHQARSCFAAGRSYLAQVGSLRCRLAGSAYIARFERVLDAIEREGYRLRADYSDCTNLTACAGLGWGVLRSALWRSPVSGGSPILPAKRRLHE
jgi:hypothetical protein